MYFSIHLLLYGIYLDIFSFHVHFILGLSNFVFFVLFQYFCLAVFIYLFINFST